MARLDVEVRNDSLHIGERFSVSFIRTLRIPDDGRTYPLPAGLGRFPVARIQDHRDRVPAEWREHGGVMIPMYQREALWLNFGGAHHKPNAVKVGVGKVDALTGAPFTMALDGARQNYLVAPQQPWLDGINAGDGMIRQFVAMPLGSGYTVEGQVTGEERFGGIQLVCFEPKPGRFPEPPPVTYAAAAEMAGAPAAAPAADVRQRAGGVRRGTEMGLGAGGRMQQKLYEDPFGVDAWDADTFGRCFIHIVNSETWREITGEPVPPTPVTADAYKAHGHPWFGLYDEHLTDIPASDTLGAVKSVGELDAGKVTDGTW
ncbi:hypothetical protein DVA67_015910 [Solirubrobacter sp. CPCC 204708]|uniref:Integral membrane protein n=1 Tax=Solirubrobacter deserti TaxID=2282478 RepID=A0ABT4RNB7_9ACTN|nr:hypothetical protein [Solirubrobacter deserti]MBE2317469.1 hypothetical protein [Solirubrobacter deserti]MDA0140051.1 hypothetical protein [Solirubrobacter deserti]